MKILIFSVLALFLLGCGCFEKSDQVGKDKVVVEELSAEQVLLIDDNCSLCHNGSNQKRIDSKARLVASAGRIANDTMPPGGGLSSEVKAILLD